MRRVKALPLIKEAVEYLESVQERLAKIYQIDERKSFAMKKKLTSAFRRVAPIGLATCIVFSMNLRTARHLHPIADFEARRRRDPSRFLADRRDSR